MFPDASKLKLLLILNLVAVVSSERTVYFGDGLTTTERAHTTDDVVIIGGLFPVHKNDDNQCGGILDLGIQRLEALVLAVRKINCNSTLLPGIRLEFEIRDTCTQANYALEQSLDFVSARGLTHQHNGTVLGVSGVVGAASSGVSIAVASLLRLFKIPQISYASTAKALSDKTRFDYFFRTIPPDSLQTRVMVDLIQQFNWTYVYAIYSEDTYGAEGIQAFINALNERNNTDMCVAIEIGIPLLASRADFDQALDTMSQSWVNNASVAVLFGQLSTATGLLNALKSRQQAGLNTLKNITWIGSDAWGDQISSELYPVAHGMLSVIPLAKKSQPFDEYFTSLNPLNNTGNPWFEEYWESIFNCTFEGTPGYRMCDPSTESISYENGYRQNSKVTFAIDTAYSFAHAITAMQHDLCPTGSGLCDEIVDFRSGGLALRGEILLQYLYNVSFSPGASADEISFDASGDEQGMFVIKNLQQKMSGNEYTLVDVGFWAVTSNESKNLVISKDIEWHEDDVPVSICSELCHGGEYPESVAEQAACCWTCKPCLGNRLVSTGLGCTECELGYAPNTNKTECVSIPHTYLQWSSPWSIIIIIVAFIGLIATSFVAIVFIVYFKNQLIKGSSRELSAFLLTGLLLCYILPFFFIIQPSPVICAIRRFGVGFCFAVCYSALLVKTNRIHRIFNRPSGSIQKPPLISPQSQVFFTLIIILVQIAIAVVWLVVEPPSIALVYSDFITELKCGESPYIGLSVSFGYNLLLLLLSTYFAFRARKVPQNFNEAKFINLTLYTTVIIWLAFIPTYFATSQLGTIYQTSSLVIGIALSATTTLCCLFAPKMYYLFSRLRKEHVKSEGSQGNERSRQESVCSFGRPGDIRRFSSFHGCDTSSLNGSFKIRSESTSSAKTNNCVSNSMPGPTFNESDGPRHFELPVVLEEEEKTTPNSLDSHTQVVVDEDDDVFSCEAPTPAIRSYPSQIVSKSAFDTTTQTFSHSNTSSSNEHLETNTLDLPPCNYQLYPHKVMKCETPIPDSGPEHLDVIPKSADEPTTLAFSHNVLLAPTSNEHLETNSSGLPPCNYQVCLNEIKKEALYRFIPLPPSRTPTPSPSLSNLHDY